MNNAFNDSNHYHLPHINAEPELLNLKGTTLNSPPMEEIPLPVLEDKVKRLDHSFQQAVGFISDQEEELCQQLNVIDQLQQQLKTATQEQSSQLLEELVEQQDRYRFLQETLVGQRRTLKRLEDTLKAHQQVLLKRQEEHKLKLQQFLLSFYYLDQKPKLEIYTQQKSKFKLSYVVIYVIFPIIILLITLPSAIFRLPPSLIFKALGDEQARNAVFSGNSSQVRIHLKRMGVEEEKLYDYLQKP